MGSEAAYEAEVPCSAQVTKARAGRHPAKAPLSSAAGHPQ